MPATNYIYTKKQANGVWRRATGPQENVETVAADAGGKWFGSRSNATRLVAETYIRSDNPPTGISSDLLATGIASHPSSRSGAAPREGLCAEVRTGNVYPRNVHGAALLELYGCLGDSGSPTPTFRAYRSGRTDLGAATNYIYTENLSNGAWRRATGPQENVETVAADAGGKWFGSRSNATRLVAETYIRSDNPPTGISSDLLATGIASHSSQPVRGGAPGGPLH